MRRGANEETLGVRINRRAAEGAVALKKILSSGATPQEVLGGAYSLMATIASAVEADALSHGRACADRKAHERIVKIILEGLCSIDNLLMNMEEGNLAMLVTIEQKEEETKKEVTH